MNCHLTVNQACSNWLRQKAFNLVPMNNHVFRQKAFNFLPMNNMFIVPKTLADAIFLLPLPSTMLFFADSTADYYNIFLI